MQMHCASRGVRNASLRSSLRAAPDPIGPDINDSAAGARDPRATRRLETLKSEGYTATVTLSHRPPNRGDHRVALAAGTGARTDVVRRSCVLPLTPRIGWGAGEERLGGSGLLHVRRQPSASYHTVPARGAQWRWRVRGGQILSAQRAVAFEGGQCREVSRRMRHWPPDTRAFTHHGSVMQYWDPWGVCPAPLSAVHPSSCANPGNMLGAKGARH